MGILLVFLTLVGLGCSSAEKERKKKIQEEVRLLEEQAAALEEENASLKASVAQLQMEVSRMSAELAAEGARISRMKTSVATMKELTAPQGFWKWLWRKIIFLFKLAVLVGIGGGLYYLFIQYRQRQAGEEVHRVVQSLDHETAPEGPGPESGSPDSNPGPAGPNSPLDSPRPGTDPQNSNPAPANPEAAAKRCQVPGCWGKLRSKGYCNKHYQQYRKGLLPEIPDA